MARHYSSNEFFRQMPNALLARYFQGRGLFDDLDFATMKEGKPDELFAAWLSELCSGISLPIQSDTQSEILHGFRACNPCPPPFRKRIIAAKANRLKPVVLTLWRKINEGGGTSCTPVGIQQRVAAAHFFDVLLHIG
jgi:hypothetical protein